MKPVFGIFMRRINRFVALVDIEGTVERVHVPSTGRMAELLIQGAPVVLHEALGKGRKTRYDLSLVEYKRGWVCVDARMANHLVGDLLRCSKEPRSEQRGAVASAILPLVDGADHIRREAPFGRHRFDFAITKGVRRVPVEVKSVNLVVAGVALFPDAPTERGTRHLHFLEHWVREGGEAHVVFVVQRSDATRFRANDRKAPAFADALYRCIEAGVRVIALGCDVSPQRIDVTRSLALEAAGSK